AARTTPISSSAVRRRAIGRSWQRSCRSTKAGDSDPAEAAREPAAVSDARASIDPLPSGWRVWIAGARPRTLPAALVPVLVGTACAAGRTDLVAWRFVAAAVVALALQVGTNYANDYSDGKRGTDSAAHRVGPLRLVGSGLVAGRL